LRSADLDIQLARKREGEREKNVPEVIKRRGTTMKRTSQFRSGEIKRHGQFLKRQGTTQIQKRFYHTHKETYFPTSFASVSIPFILIAVP